MKNFIIFLILIFGLNCCFGITKPNYKRVKNVKITYSDFNNTSYRNNNGLVIYFIMKFDEFKKIKVIINKNVISTCDSCATNYSLGFVLKENHDIFRPHILSNQIKVGDILKIFYGNEFIQIKINKVMLKYPYLSVYRDNDSTWELSFKDTGYSGDLE